ncbi:MAG: NAD(P)-dependent oxidoreductase [Anaerolineae bacterium]|nr:NAD(P)-dependent oxidoreductase [Anaerolineae bacterium]
MHVLVTGGMGDVGRAAVQRLVQHGHRVRVVGRTPGLHVDGAEYRACDVTDFGLLREQVRGVDAIVHLAAIRHPSMAPGQEIFRVNCTGTYNVYRAAADEGIARVVSASSINALGYYFGARDFPLRYLPIDEQHPTCTTDPYSFSKQVLEATAHYFWRREGISGVCLRLPAVYEVTEESETLLGRFVARARADTLSVLELPPAAQQERVRQILTRAEEMRRQRTWEGRLQDYGMDLPDAALVFARNNFWTSVDSRDSAQAIEQALLGDYQGCHPLYVNDSRNFAGLESELLARVFFPDVAARAQPLVGAQTLVSIDAARALLGFEPAYSILDW